MTSPGSNSQQQDITKQAHHWHAKVVVGDLDVHEKEHFETWLNASESHRGAYERAQVSWSRLGSISREDYPEELLQVSDHTSQGIKVALVQLMKPLLRWPGRDAAAIACAAMLVIAVAWFAVPFQSPDPALYSTAAAEIRRINLEDGSTVILGAESRIGVELENQRRTVYLYAGDAYFKVAHNPDQPFTVSITSTLVRVIGTEFAVSKRHRTTEISVAHGEVSVAQGVDANAALPKSATSLVPQQRIRVIENEMTAIDTVSLNEIATWRRGTLIYVDTRLDEIMEDVDRYYQGDITILDPATRALSMSLVLDATDIQGLLQTLETALPIRVDHRDDGTILIRTRQ